MSDFALDKMIAEITQIHFPKPPARPADISRFESMYGYRLPTDMRRFLLACNGASLFRADCEPPPFRLLGVSEICRARFAVFGDDSQVHGADSHFVFCDRGDGDFIGIDLNPLQGDCREVFDVWHEAYPEMEYCATIASSFTSFLELALRSGGNSVFWLTAEV